MPPPGDYGGYPPGPGGPYGPPYPDAGTPAGKSKAGLFLGVGGGALAVVVIAVVAVVLFRGAGGQVDDASGGSGGNSGASGGDGSPVANGGDASGRTLVAADTAGGLTRDKAYEQQLEQQRKQLQQKYGNNGPGIDLEKLKQQQKQQAAAAGLQAAGTVSAVYRGEGVDPNTGEPRRVRFFGFYGEIQDPEKTLDYMTQLVSDVQGITVKRVETGQLGGVAAGSNFATTIPPIADQEATVFQNTTCTWADKSTYGTIIASRGVSETADLMRRMRPDLTQ